MANKLNTIAKGAGIVFFGGIIAKLIGYIYLLIISRLGASEYGTISLAITLLFLFATISLLGLDVGVIRYVSYYKGEKDNKKIRGTIISALKIGLTTSIIISIILLLFSNQIAINIFNNPELAQILKIFFIIIPIWVTSKIIMAIARAFQKVEYDMLLANISEKIIRVISTAILLSLGFGLISVAYSYLISYATIMAVSLIVIQKFVFPYISKTKPIELKKKLIKYSIPLVFAWVAYILISKTDIIMLGIFRTTAEVGTYNVAVPTSELILMLPSAMMALFLPVLAEEYGKQNLNNMKKVYNTISKWVFLFNLPLLLIIMIYSKHILRILFGQEYIIGSTSLVILSLACFVYTLGLTSYHTLLTLKKTKKIFRILLAVLIMNVILNSLLIPPLGTTGGAIATLISLTISTILYIKLAHKELKVQPIKKSMIKPITSGILSIYLVYQLTKLSFTTVPIWGLILMLILFLILYTTLMILLKGFDKEDLQIVKDFEKKTGIKLLSKIIKT